METDKENSQLATNETIVIVYLRICVSKQALKAGTSDYLSMPLIPASGTLASRHKPIQWVNKANIGLILTAVVGR